jgi:large subunit ribosomal protein L24
MAKRHVKKGDEVVVITGSQRGKRGKIIEVLTGKNRVIVEGVAMIKRHTKKNQNNPQGAIVEREPARRDCGARRNPSYLQCDARG